MKVLVVGGGIGGLCAALALRREGYEVDVVERDPEWGVYGVGIIQPGNALRALDQLGLADACVAEGHPIRGDRTFLADGETQIAAHQWPSLKETSTSSSDGAISVNVTPVRTSVPDSSVREVRISCSLGRVRPLAGGRRSISDGHW
jgi:2-polyprenyl-6-methoxyphenol hydroxylase-like FAD-dependent oxidoreductase